MCEKFSCVPDFTSFVSVHSGELFNKTFHKLVPKDLCNLAAPLSQKPIEPNKSSFLHTAFNYHIAYFLFSFKPSLHFHEFMHAFFEIN